MRYLLPLLIVMAACSDPSWCAATYYFSPPDSGWTHPDSVDAHAPVVEPDSVTVEPCTH
jgi:hypothetical protein